MFGNNNYKRFKDRADAGRQLGEYLKPKYGELNPLVMGIPRGGVAVAYYVAAALDTKFSIIVSRKLSFPGNPELGFGAVTEEHQLYVSGLGKDLLGQAKIEAIVKTQFAEVERQLRVYRMGLPLPDMKGRIVILVDDGIAMGVTLVPLIGLCRKKGASKVILAVPVSGRDYDLHLYRADAIEVLVQSDHFHGVGQVYRQFGALTDQQVLAFVNFQKG